VPPYSTPSWGGALPTPHHQCSRIRIFRFFSHFKQESLAIAKTTARCAQYMGALKSFESPRKRSRLLFPKFVKGFCSDRY